MRQRRQGICAFCGNKSVVTTEHFVPKCLWPGRLPSHVLTVPSCPACNQGCSREDEYFRDVVAISAAKDHPQAKELFHGRVRRNLALNRRRLRQFMDSFALRPCETPEGIWLGLQPSVLVNEMPINRVLCKVVLGLFYCARGRPLPSTHNVYLMTDPTKVKGSFLEDALAGMSPEIGFGDDVFLWRFCGDTVDWALTRWVLIFFRSMCFLAATLPDNVDDRHDPEPV